MASLAARTRALEASEARYRTIFEASPVPLWVYEVATKRFLAVNDAAVAVYGWSREEFLGGLTLADVRPVETLPEFERRYRRAHERDAAARHEAGRWRHRTRDGRELWVEIVTHEMEYEGRRARVAQLLDVTERVTAERRRAEDAAREALARQSQKLEAVGLLAGGIAHDFNNLLTVVVSNASIARELLPPDSPVGTELDEIMDAARRGAALTRQLLAFGRQQAISPARVDLHAAARDAGRLLVRLVGQEVRLAFDARGGPAMVYADPGHLAQVIMNLVVNARDAMPEGGTITVTTAAGVPLPAGAPHPATPALPGADAVQYDDARGALLTVHDTGTGMSAETVRRAFEPFYTTKPEGQGTGLGLATVFGIVRQAGGSVWIDSARERGTTVSVWLRGAK
jgi:two-component system cell cycle sensor histidine kinase/response regulator CckA